MAILLLFYLAVIVLMIAGTWKTFEKAGKPGWAAIVPIYNYVVMAEIGRKPAWWGALVLIPFAGIVFAIWILNMVSKSFGKDEGFTVGLVLLPFVFFPILGFGDAKYLHGNEAPSNPDVLDSNLHVLDSSSSAEAQPAKLNMILLIGGALIAISTFMPFVSIFGFSMSLIDTGQAGAYLYLFLGLGCVGVSIKSSRVLNIVGLILGAIAFLIMIYWMSEIGLGAAGMGMYAGLLGCVGAIAGGIMPLAKSNA